LKAFGYSEIPAEFEGLLIKSTPAVFYPSKLFAKTKLRRKGRGAHRDFYQKTTASESAHGDPRGGTDKSMVVHIDRLGRRLLRCGVCWQRCRQVDGTRPQRELRDLAMRRSCH
jgi:hypothetical protein